MSVPYVISVFIKLVAKYLILYNKQINARALPHAILPLTSRKKSRLLFCFGDTFARISIQMICFSIKLETEWFDIFFQNAVRESIM